MEREQYRDELRLFAYLMSGSLSESESMTDQVLDAEAGESCSGETDIRVLLHAHSTHTASVSTRSLTPRRSTASPSASWSICPSSPRLRLITWRRSRSIRRTSRSWAENPS